MTFHNAESTFSCDECPETIDCDGREFVEAKEFATSKGWRTFKGPDKKWANACPVCVASFAKDQRNAK